MKTNTEVQKLKKQLQEIQQKLEEIEKESSNSEHNDSLIKNPFDDTFYYLEDCDNDFVVSSWHNYDYDPSENSVHFADEEQCERYAEAFTTFILLRKQPGTEVPKEGVTQYFIGFGSGMSIVVDPKYYNFTKFEHISPCFNSEESACKAIETLGEERIRNMFKYFHS